MISLILMKINLLVFSLVYSLATLLEAILYFLGGVISDIIGRKKIMIFGSLTKFIGLLMIYAFYHYKIIETILLCMGVLAYLSGGAISASATYLLFMESCKKGTRGRIYSINTTLLILSAMAGSTILSYTASIFSLLFSLGIATFCLLCVVISRFFIIETLKKESQIKSSGSLRILGNVRLYLRTIREDKNMLLYTCYLLIMALSSTVVEIILPVFLQSDVGLSTVEIGMFYSILFLLGGVPMFIGGIFVDKLGAKRAMIIGFGLEAFFGLLFIFTIQTSTLLGLAFYVLQATGVWFIHPGVFALEAYLTERKKRGAIIGGWRAIATIISSLSPVIIYVVWPISHILPFVIAIIVDIIVIFLIAGIEYDVGKPDEETSES